VKLAYNLLILLAKKLQNNLSNEQMLVISFTNRAILCNSWNIMSIKLNTKHKRTRDYMNYSSLYMNTCAYMSRDWQVMSICWLFKFLHSHSFDTCQYSDICTKFRIYKFLHSHSFDTTQVYSVNILTSVIFLTQEKARSYGPMPLGLANRLDTTCLPAGQSRVPADPTRMTCKLFLKIGAS